MKHFAIILSNLRDDESGQDLIEYALIATLLSLAAIVGVGALGTKVAGVWTSLTNAL